MVTPSAGAAASGTNDGTRDRGSGLRGEGGDWGRHQAGAAASGTNDGTRDRGSGLRGKGGLRAAPGRGGGLGD